MDGIEGAVSVVTERLKAALPAKTAALRERYGINPDTDGDLLPDVVTVEPFDRPELGLEEYPAVLVAGLSTEQVRRAEVTGTGTRWLARYELRAFVLLRGESTERLSLARQRLTLAVRELLLVRKTMTDAAMVDDTTLAESYSDFERAKTGTYAGSYVAFSLWVEETLDDEIESPGRVEFEPELDTTRLPPHPAL